MTNLFKITGTVTLKKGAGRQLKSGGMWVYDNEIDTFSETVEDGGLIELHDFDDYFMGIGFVNRRSKITVRMLSRHEGEINEEFIKQRVKDAVSYRMDTVDTSSCRLIFGEADFLPGIVIDKFSDVLVVESLALGIDRFKQLIVDDLKEILKEYGMPIRGVYERSDAKVRQLEGMERVKGFIGEEFDTKVMITENGVKYYVDVKDGQKTGFFLDQKYNRRAVARLAAGHTVLDCFTHTGSFALNVASGGAARVTAADISADAIAMAQRNAERNGLTNMDFLCEDTFELLPRLEKEGHPYDFIILDPPAFTKSRKTVKSAERGYKDINLRALRLLPRGGYFATASCSHFMPSELFEKMLRSAALDAGVELRQIEARQQSPDHPILWNVPETDYLKFYLFQVV